MNGSRTKHIEWGRPDSKKINVICTHSYVVSRCKAKKKQPTVYNPRQLRPKRDILGST